MTQTPDIAVRAHRLSKIYRKGKSAFVALDQLQLDIPRGSLFALLGPNGAGKSTFINILAGLVRKSSGKIHIWDIDIDEDHRNAKMHIGIVPQELNLDPFFTPRQILELHAGLYGVTKKNRHTDELLTMLELRDKADSYPRSLSGGMRRRLMIAKAMVHQPPILVLDEPTAGVDIELRQKLWERVRELNSQGTTIILTTHYLEEAEELCDTIAIIDKGKVIACDAKANLLARIDQKELIITSEQKISDISQHLHQLGGERTDDFHIRIPYASRQTSVAPLLDACRASGIVIRDITTRQSDLEDIFRQLTRK